MDGVKTTPGDPAEEEQPFTWTKNWYPCHVIDMMDPERPHKFTLLGIDLVLWRDGDGVWRAFEDRCPHRLAPLSEGRVEADGTLLCAYHAWRFDGTGSCTSLPSAKSAESERRLCAQSKSCARAFPTRSDLGLLWVWPEVGADGLLESSQKAPYIPPEMAPGYSGTAVVLPWGLRDLPYGWEAYMENVSDAAHVPVSHHKIMGNRYTDPHREDYDYPTLRRLSDQGGFHIGPFDFQPPYSMRVKPSDLQKLQLYNVPTKPGHSRYIGTLIVTPPQQAAGPFAAARGCFTLPVPKWLLHISGSFFLHQDLVFLHHQEKILRHKSKQHTTWMAECFLPTPADRPTINFHRWLASNGEPDAHGKASVPWTSVSGIDSHMPPPITDGSLFDVYHTHVAHCTHCQAALRNTRRVRAAATCVAIVAAERSVAVGVLNAAAVKSSFGDEFADMGVDTLAGAAAYLGLWFPPEVAQWMLAALAFTVVAAASDKLMALFHVYKYNHQDNE